MAGGGEGRSASELDSESTAQLRKSKSARGARGKAKTPRRTISGGPSRKSPVAGEEELGRGSPPFDELLLSEGSPPHELGRTESLASVMEEDEGEEGN